MIAYVSLQIVIPQKLFPKIGEKESKSGGTSRRKKGNGIIEGEPWGGSRLCLSQFDVYHNCINQCPTCFSLSFGISSAKKSFNSVLKAEALMLMLLR